MAEELPCAGWYPHPQVINTQRYWDGKAWTEKTRKKPGAKNKPGRYRSPEAAHRPQETRTGPNEKKGSQVLATGLVDNTTTMKIYRDGTFTIKGAWTGQSAPDRLVAFDHDLDSMRRKSVTGRGTAALLTGGASLLASNNRGVVYVTVTGELSGVKTYTARNPSGTALTSIRSLKAAADQVIGHSSAQGPTGSADVFRATEATRGSARGRGTFERGVRSGKGPPAGLDLRGWWHAQDCAR